MDWLEVELRHDGALYEEAPSTEEQRRIDAEATAAIGGDTQVPLNTLKNIDIAANAIVQEWSDYEDVRRKHSQALYGHQGAHVSNLPMPTPATLAQAVLTALDKAGVAG